MRKFAGMAAGLAVAGLGACAQMTTGAETVAQLPRRAVESTVDAVKFIFTRPENGVEVVEMGRLPQCNSTGREPALELLADRAAVEAWQAARGVQITPTSGALPDGSYVIAEMGERNTGGYALAVSRQAASKDGTLYVKASFLVPGNADMVTQGAVSPCSLVLIPAGYGRVLLVDQSNTVRASWAAAAVKG